MRLFDHSSAVISERGKYRYSFGRGEVVFIMLNPSSAGTTKGGLVVLELLPG